MENKPYLTPARELTDRSISSATACLKSGQSFVPSNGNDQVCGTPSDAFKSGLAHKDFRYKTQCLPLLYKLTVHPRESVRDWAESQLNRLTTDDRIERVLSDSEIPIIFPWRQKKPYFHFSPTRALQLTRHETVTLDMAEFLVGFRHETISAKLIHFITRQPPVNEEGKLPSRLDRLLRQITTSHLPNARRMIARSRVLNWRVFDELMEQGLPLYTQDAIAHVDWDLYSKHAAPNARKETITHLKRFAKHAPPVAEQIKNWNLK